MARVKVLYEDQRASQNNRNSVYGPHELVCWLILDQLAGPQLQLFELQRRVLAFPKKGASKVYAAHADERECARLTRDGSLLIALYDDDHEVRRQVHLSATSCRSETKAKLTASAGRTSIVFLKRSMETVLGAVADVLGEPALDEKPTPNERDRRLKKICGADKRQQRELLLQTVPDLRYLVDKIVAELMLQQSLGRSNHGPDGSR